MDVNRIRSYQNGQDSVTTRAHIRGLADLGSLARGLAVALAILVSACGGAGDGSSSRMGTDTFEVEFEPVWSASPPQELEPLDSADRSAPKAVDIYVDLSIPVGGFIPLGNAATPEDTLNRFRTVAQWVPDHLTRVYPAAETLRWFGVGQEIVSLGQNPHFRRGLFDATATRLDLAIQQAVADLRAGRTEAVAVITDLVGTGELTGALSVSRHLQPWLASESVRSGSHHLGLLGVKADYWGVAAPSCPLVEGLGCWYSERGREWRRMERKGQTPFYVLLMGRNSESVSEVLESIEQDALALQHDVDMRFELLTERTAHRTIQMIRRASDEYAIRRDDEGRYRCVTDAEVRISFGFGADTVSRPDSSEARGKWPEKGFSGPGLDGSEVVVDVNCDTVQNQDPGWNPALLLDIVATLDTDSDTPTWDGCSIETDDLPEFPGKTLQLKYFIEEVRLIPERYRAIGIPVFGGR